MMVVAILGILVIKFICFYYILEPTYGKQVRKNLAYASWMLLLSLVAYLLYSLTIGLIFFLAMGKGSEPIGQILNHTSIISYSALVLASIILISLFEYILFYHFRKMPEFKQRFVWNILLNAMLIGIIATNSHNFEFFMVGIFYVLFIIVFSLKGGRF
jgi:hypothetical protein